MTLLDVSVPFGLGFVSSLHCAGMCGPIVLAYTIPLRSAATPRLLTAHLSYNAGRILTYSLMGAVAGALGGGIVTVGHMAGLERQAAVVIGILMIAVGLIAGGWFRTGRLISIGSGVPGVFSRSFGRLLRAGNRFTLGALMGFLPCGLVYAALLQAMSTSNAADGAISMAAFGTGTAFTLLGIGMVSGSLTAKLGRYSGVLMSASVIVLGVIAIWRGLNGPVIPGRCH